jgi:hypothetical protein
LDMLIIFHKQYSLHALNSLISFDLSLIAAFIACITCEPAPK